MIIASFVLLQILGLLAAIDGLYLHLWKLKLHRRADSYREHLWHTARAVFFVPIVLIIYVAPTAGALLWLGVAFIAADAALALIDVLSERDSRASLGGLSSFEYAIHVIATTAHSGSIALVLASRPAEAWSWSAPSTIGAYPPMIEQMAIGMIPVSAVVAIVHVWLAWRHRPSTASAARHAVAEPA